MSTLSLLGYPVAPAAAAQAVDKGRGMWIVPRINEPTLKRIEGARLEDEDIFYPRFFPSLPISLEIMKGRRRRERGRRKGKGKGGFSRGMRHGGDPIATLLARMLLETRRGGHSPPSLPLPPFYPPTLPASLPPSPPEQKGAVRTKLKSEERQRSHFAPFLRS